MATAGATIASSATVEDAITAVTVEDAMPADRAGMDMPAEAEVAMQPIADVRAAQHLYRPVAAMVVPAVAPTQGVLAQQWLVVAVAAAQHVVAAAVQLVAAEVDHRAAVVVEHAVAAADIASRLDAV
jgi:hypothetical protein